MAPPQPPQSIVQHCRGIPASRAGVKLNQMAAVSLDPPSTALVYGRKTWLTVHNASRACDSLRSAGVPPALKARETRALRTRPAVELLHGRSTREEWAVKDAPKARRERDVMKGTGRSHQ